MKLSEHQRLFTWHIGQLIMFAYARGLELTLGHAWRSPEEQERLWKAGKSQIRTGGKHGSRLAVDFNLFKNGELTWKWEDYKELGDYWEKLDKHNVWGGDWNQNDIKDGFIDSPHFERKI